MAEEAQDSWVENARKGSPFALFDDWMALATQSEPNDPNAMALATSGLDGVPSVRIVLLKGRDERGFVFYTNVESRKGVELLTNPKAALCFHWKTLRRQIRVEGEVEPVTAAEADAYYATRARDSRIGAWASLQSRPLPDRSDLERRVAEFAVQFPGDEVPRPPNWSGFRVVPGRIEFWMDRPYRLHDRLVFTREGAGWATHRLYP